VTKGGLKTMTVLTNSVYGISTTVAMPFDQAVERVKEAFKAEQFGTLSEIDVRKTLQEKTGEEIEPYTILGMCNPQLASRAIKAEHEIGLMLPCNVLVHECGGQVRVSAQDPLALLQLAQNEALRSIAEEAKQRIERVLQTLGR
jgi:uncharacterized protein (DUF302 family)